MFTKFGVEEDVPGLHPHAKLHRRGFKKYGFKSPEIAKIGNL